MTLHTDEHTDRQCELKSSFTTKCLGGGCVVGVADEDGKITGKQYCQCSFVYLIYRAFVL